MFAQPGWPGALVGVQFFSRPLADVAFLKTAGRGVAEHLDEEAEAQCNAM